MNEQDIYKKLAAPFPLDDLEWRVQHTGKGKTKPGDKAMMLPYVTARAVYERLSEALGVGHWRHTVRKEAGGWIAKIEAKIGDEWVWHEDGSPETDIEAFKGGISKAVVRCAVNFGVGAYLYDFPFQWVTLEGSGPTGYPPRNWKPDISKIPPDCRPARGGGRPAEAAPPPRIVDVEPPEDSPPVTAPGAVSHTVAEVVEPAKQQQRMADGPAAAAYKKIEKLLEQFELRFNLAAMVPAKDPKNQEPWVMFAEAAVRPEAERAKSKHWSKLRWVIDTWPKEKGDDVRTTALYKGMAIIDAWAKEVRDCTQSGLAASSDDWDPAVE